MAQDLAQWLANISENDFAELHKDWWDTGYNWWFNLRIPQDIAKQLCEQNGLHDVGGKECFLVIDFDDTTLFFPYGLSVVDYESGNTLTVPDKILEEYDSTLFDKANKVAEKITIDKIINSLIENGFDELEDETYQQNSFVELSSGDVHLSLKGICPKERRRELDIDIVFDILANTKKYQDATRHGVFFGQDSEYADCYLNINNRLQGAPRFELQINTDEREETYELSVEQVKKFKDAFPYHIYTYDKDRGAEILCGFAKNDNEVKQMTDWIYDTEMGRTDVNREESGAYDIDGVLIKNGDNETYVSFIDYEKSNMEVNR